MVGVVGKSSGAASFLTTGTVQGPVSLFVPGVPCHHEAVYSCMGQPEKYGTCNLEWEEKKYRTRVQ